jgi:hypothetical protein
MKEPSQQLRHVGDNSDERLKAMIIHANFILSVLSIYSTSCRKKCKKQLNSKSLRLPQLNVRVS